MSNYDEEITNLKNEFYNLLEVKNSNDIGVISIHKTPGQVFDEILKVMKPMKDSDKKLMLLALINVTKYEISKNVFNCEEMFYSLPTIAKDFKRKNRERMEELANFELISRDNFKNDTDKLIDRVIGLFSHYNREELESYENVCNNVFKEKSSVFGLKDVNGRLIGELNRGMYGHTRDEIIELYRNCGIKISSGDRFIDNMSDELLKYRIAGLFIASRYCDKVRNEWESTLFSSDSYPGKKALDKTRARTKELGIILRDKYISKNKKSPFEEITTNIFGNQGFMMEVYPKLNDILEDERGSKGRK